jgi:phosphatidylserine decarboxylase
MESWLRFKAWCKVWPQTIAPQHGLSRLMQRLASSERPWLVRWMIRTLMARYPIDLRDALEPDPTRYRSLNAFFTRALRTNTRPLPVDSALITSPADGQLSQFGVLTGQHLLQAKGHHYSVNQLLAVDANGAAAFDDGHYATIYLAPHNYHRVHAPCDGTINEVVYVPGRLFSVNTLTASVVPDLFARNERVILRCSGEGGEFAVVLVGAMLVGSMILKCFDLAPLYAQRLFKRHRFETGISVVRGEEIGYFNMGSTVILVFARGAIEWNADAVEGDSVLVGQALGRWLDPVCHVDTET